MRDDRCHHHERTILMRHTTFADTEYQSFFGGPSWYQHYRFSQLLSSFQQRRRREEIPSFASEPQVYRKELYS